MTQRFARHDAYGLRHLPRHLARSGRFSVLRQLLFDGDWLQAKLGATDASALVNDFELLPPDPAVTTVGQALQLARHVLTRRPADLPAQILGRLLGETDSDIRRLVDQARRWSGSAWLRPQTPSLTTPSEPLLHTLEGHTGMVQAVAIAPDGSRAVSASADRTLIVWDLTSGQALRRQRDHRGPVNAVALTPDGREAVSGAEDGVVKIWEVTSGVCRLTLSAGQWPVCALAVSPDGRLVAGLAGLESDHEIGCTLAVWQLDTGTLVDVLTTQQLDLGRYAVAWLPDSEQMIFEAGGGLGLKTSSLVVYNWRTHRLAPLPKSNLAGARALCVSPDGRRLLAGCADGVVRVWSLPRGGLERTWRGHSDTVNAVAFTADQRRALSAASDATLRVWNLTTGRCEQTLTGHSGGVLGVQSLPGGQRVISAAGDRTMKLWQLDQPARARPAAEHTTGIMAVRVSPDGRHVVTGSADRTLKVWDLLTGRLQRTLRGHTQGVESLAVTPDGRRIVSCAADRTVKVWDLQSGRLERSWRVPAGRVWCVTAASDGQHIISAADDYALRVWDLHTGQLVRTVGEVRTDVGLPRGRVGVTLLADGRRAVKFDPWRYEIWDWHTGHKLAEQWLVSSRGQDLVTALTVTPDSRRVIAFTQAGVRAWDLDTQRWELLDSNPGHVLGAAATTECLVAASHHHRYLRVLAFDPYSPADAVFVDDAALYCCDVAPDGRTIVAGGHSGRLHILAVEGFSLGRPVICAWQPPVPARRGFGRPPPDQRLGAGCPHCRKWTEITQAQLGTEWACPACGQESSLNPIPVVADWRPVARAWR